MQILVLATKTPTTAQYVSNKDISEKIRGVQNRVKFENIEAPEAGMYDLKLYVVSGSKKKLSIRINQYESVQVTDIVGISGNSSAVGCVSTQVYLDKGKRIQFMYIIRQLLVRDLIVLLYQRQKQQMLQFLR